MAFAPWLSYFLGPLAFGRPPVEFGCAETAAKHSDRLEIVAALAVAVYCAERSSCVMFPMRMAQRSVGHRLFALAYSHRYCHCCLDDCLAYLLALFWPVFLSLHQRRAVVAAAAAVAGFALFQALDLMVVAANISRTNFKLIFRFQYTNG